MTESLTEKDLVRIERRAADSDECNLTPYWRHTVPALVAALREARAALSDLRAARVVGETVAD